MHFGDKKNQLNDDQPKKADSLDKPTDEHSGE